MKLNPTCKIKDTRKIFYSQYLYKAVLYVPLGHILRSKPHDRQGVDDVIAIRKSTFFRASKPGTWSYYNRKEQYQNVNADQLVYWKDCLHDHRDTVKYRIEEPWLQLYSNNEQLIFDLISKDSQSLREFYKPKSELAKSILESNQILIAKPTEYQYKIYLREGIKLTDDIRSSIGQYLINLGNEVKIPKATKHNFTSRRVWFTNCYLYAKDDQIATFLTLMAPGIVSGIFKQVYIKP